ncbi:hypothetical protein PybrP1_000284 [[Pythium] brassicae (nom. inval.)]|nr:hypothetical protein PybrP1_000284 [[Pythium] brassicae (nom. inval.)]
MGNGASTEIEIFAEGELEAEFKRLNGAADMGLKKFVKKSYNDVIQMVIRPPRATYLVEALGELEFPLPASVDELMRNGLSLRDTNGSDSAPPAARPFVRRHDFHVLNERELKVLCSHWRLYANRESAAPTPSPCLIYLHSNLGSRLDALRVRDLALQRGFSVLAFDFAGSGLSDGLFVTMGWNETNDLHAVLQHVEADASVQDLCIFAHSMGTYPAIVNVASRALPLVDRKQRESMDALLPAYLRSANVNALAKPIRGLVLDGAFSSMKTLIKEFMASIQGEGFDIPKPLLKLACSVVEQSVKKRTDVTLEKLRPVEFVAACFVPALFVVGAADRYVAPQHSEALAAQYGGPAVIKKVDGEHYTPRLESVYSEAVDFLDAALRSRAMGE